MSEAAYTRSRPKLAEGAAALFGLSGAGVIHSVIDFNAAVQRMEVITVLVG